ncbi:MAG: response regulator transcription factor [Prolixibacteraceae bacterium]|nr:response regulator transcription factor [Prolixibacteraceae bacterium]
MSLKLLIFEDESLSAEHLVNLINRYDSSVEIQGIMESVKQGVEWLNNHPEPDLLLMDIQLSDGSCFELFKQISQDIPVIFTTAYNEYAVQAFKVNSIDYLLKPIDFQELKLAFEKFRKQGKKRTFNPEQIYDQVYSRLIQNSQYKKRLLVKIGEQLKQVNTEDIAYFLFNEGMCWAVTFAKNRLPVDYSLDEIEQMFDPKMFYRINRKFIVRPEAIEKIHTYFNNRLKLQLRPDPETDVLVSRERVSDFKNWLNS